MVNVQLTIFSCSLYFFPFSKPKFTIAAQNKRQITHDKKKKKKPLCFSAFHCKFLDKNNLCVHISRTTQKTQHMRRGIDLYFAADPAAPLLFSTPSNLHCPALAQSPWVIFTFRPRFLLIFLKPLCIFPSLSGRLVCSAHTQLCIPALKATSSQMPVLAGDYLSNALWLVHTPRQNHSGEMKLDRLL